jgi:hypothetical protein
MWKQLKEPQSFSINKRCNCEAEKLGNTWCPAILLFLSPELWIASLSNAGFPHFLESAVFFFLLNFKALEVHENTGDP